MKIKNSRAAFTLLELLICIAILALLAAIAIPQQVRAEVGTKNFGIGQFITNNTTLTGTNTGVAVKIDNRDNCSMVFNGFGSTAQTGNISFTFMRSADNVTWETQPGFIWVVPLTGAATTNTVAWTNFPQSVIGSAGYIKCVGITNANSTALATNASLKLVDKKIE